MTVRAITATLAALLALSGCATDTPPQPRAADEAGVEPDGPPIPALKVGQPFVADLHGNGQATITVLATEVTDQAIPGEPPVSGPHVRLVVTVKIQLDKAGDPITGGPRNFRFMDKGKTLHDARTHAAAFPPELTPVQFATVGQQSTGKLYFTVPRDRLEGGDIQLMTGKLVHALWRV